MWVRSAVNSEIFEENCCFMGTPSLRRSAVVSENVIINVWCYVLLSVALNTARIHRFAALFYAT